MQQTPGHKMVIRHFPLPQYNTALCAAWELGQRTEFWARLGGCFAGRLRKKKVSIPALLPGVNGEQYGNVQNEGQAWSPAGRRQQTLLGEPQSVLSRTFGRQNKTGWALFVNSRNQRKFLVGGVKHSRVKVNCKQFSKVGVWKRRGHRHLERGI